MLRDIWAQLGNALDVYYRNDIRSSQVENLEQAVLKIEELLAIQPEQDLLGTGPASRVRARPSAPRRDDGPPAPASRNEADKYQRLLGKLDGSYKVAEAIIANEARRHANLNREELITRIVQRFERQGR